jgi:hypothetical protein
VHQKGKGCDVIDIFIVLRISHEITMQLRFKKQYRRISIAGDILSSVVTD